MNKRGMKNFSKQIKKMRKCILKTINKKGFTLVELLATILVLSIVVSITMYIAINTVNKAKQKTYQITIANITNNADNYLTENSNRLFFVPDGSYEYQCITVNNLIELGYLDSEVLNSKVDENKTVSGIPIFNKRFF